MDSSASGRGVGRLLDRVGDWLTDTRFLGLGGVLLTLLVAVFRSGFGMFPEASLQQQLFLARDFPQPTWLPTESTYLFNSMVGPPLAHYLGFTSQREWLLMSIVMLSLAVVVVVVMARHAAGAGAAGLLMAVFAAAGVSTVLFGWVGSYDVYTFIGLTIMALSRTWWLAGLAAVLVGANAFEMGVVVLLALCVLGWADGGTRWRLAVAGLVGILLGHVLVLWWQHAYAVESISRLDFANGVGLATILGQSLAAMPTLAFTWLAASWLFVGWAAYQRIVTWWRAAAALLLVFLPALLALDQTRIGALAAWPLLAWIAVLAIRDRRAQAKRAIAATLLCACVYPALVIWEGHAHLLTPWLAN